MPGATLSLALLVSGVAGGAAFSTSLSQRRCKNSPPLAPALTKTSGGRRKAMPTRRAAAALTVVLVTACLTQVLRSTFFSVRIAFHSLSLAPAGELGRAGCCSRGPRRALAAGCCSIDTSNVHRCTASMAGAGAGIMTMAMA